MSTLVSPEDIEAIVGVQRHPSRHYARIVSTEQMTYILHSHQCRDSTPDLRDCPYSLALDRGLGLDHWTMDVPLVVVIEGGRLHPELEDE